MVHRIRVFLLSCGLALAVPGFTPADAPATQTAADASYEATIRKRANDAVTAIGLSDKHQAARVQDIIAGQYRSLKDIDDTTDQQVKAAGEDKEKIAAINAESATRTIQLHDKFLAALAKELTPEQVDIVKDKMTYNVLHVTFKAYCDMIPALSAEQKAYIMDQLKEARELAMDGGSSKEKHAIFGKYKGRINIYLSKAGYNLKDEEKAWREREKAKRAAATQPTR